MSRSSTSCAYVTLHQVRGISHVAAWTCLQEGMQLSLSFLDFPLLLGKTSSLSGGVHEFLIIQWSMQGCTTTLRQIYKKEGILSSVVVMQNSGSLPAAVWRSHSQPHLGFCQQHHPAVPGTSCSDGIFHNTVCIHT